MKGGNFEESISLLISCYFLLVILFNYLIRRPIWYKTLLMVGLGSKIVVRLSSAVINMLFDQRHLTYTIKLDFMFSSILEATMMTYCGLFLPKESLFLNLALFVFNVGLNLYFYDSSSVVLIVKILV